MSNIKKSMLCPPTPFIKDYRHIFEDSSRTLKFMSWRRFLNCTFVFYFQICRYLYIFYLCNLSLYLQIIDDVQTNSRIERKFFENFLCKHYGYKIT